MQNIICAVYRRSGLFPVFCRNVGPDREIRRFIVYADLLGPVAVISNLFGNIAIFMPFGFLVPILGRKKRKFWFTALASFELSLSVECIQLITKTGCFDVDDIFLNTIGGILGYLVYALMQRKRDRDADARRLKERS